VLGIVAGALPARTKDWAVDSRDLGAAEATKRHRPRSASAKQCIPRGCNGSQAEQFKEVPAYADGVEGRQDATTTSSATTCSNARPAAACSGSCADGVPAPPVFRAAKLSAFVAESALLAVIAILTTILGVIAPSWSSTSGQR
jgi:hypothetical protein